MPQMNKPSVFVLMPFDEEFNAVYEKIIAPTLSKAGYEVSRADSNIAQQNILRDIVRGISQAAIVVADLTTMNANVLYELGIAHALRKPTIIIVQQIRDLPFDLRSYRVIMYSTKFNEIGRLEQSLFDFTQHFSGNPLDFGNPVVDYLPISIAACQPAHPVETKSEPYGFMDFIVLSQPVQLRLETQMKAINDRIVDIGKKLNERAVELREMKAAGGANLMARAYQKIEQVAKEIQEFSDTIDARLPEFRAARNEFEDLFISYMSAFHFNEKERASAIDAGRAALDLQNQGKAAIQSFEELRNSLKEAKGASRSMNHALSHADHSMEGLISEFSLLFAFAVRIKNLIDDKIAALDAKTLKP